MRIQFSKRRGIIDSGIIILGIVVAIVAIVAATIEFSDLLEEAFVGLTTDMPRFDYQIEGGVETGNEMFEFYKIIRDISLVLLVLIMIIAGVSLMVEAIDLLPPDTSYQMISKSFLFSILIFAFPIMWDLVAISVEEFALLILNPENPDNPNEHFHILLQKLSGIESPEFSMPELVAGIADPFKSLQDMFVSVFLAAFRAVALLIFIFMAFMIGTIRIVFTSVLIVSLPILLMLSLIPWFKRITDKFIDAFLGVTIVPIFTSLAATAGVSVLISLEEKGIDPFQEWFSALAVMALVVFMPVMVVPMLSSIVSSISSIATGSVSAGVGVTALGGLGALRGAGQAMSGIGQASAAAGQPLSTLGLAKQAFGTRAGFGAVTKGIVHGTGAGLAEGLTRSMHMGSKVKGSGGMNLSNMGMPGFHAGHGGSGHHINPIEQIGIQAGEKIVVDNAVKDISTQINAATPQVSFGPQPTIGAGPRMSITPLGEQQIIKETIGHSAHDGFANLTDTQRNTIVPKVHEMAMSNPEGFATLLSQPNSIGRKTII